MAGKRKGSPSKGFPVKSRSPIRLPSGVDVSLPIPPEIKLREFASGVVSTKSPRYGLIWPSALRALARRMERGVRVKGDGACNALSAHNKMATEDAQFVIDRLEHGIEHCYKAIARIAGNLPELDEQDTADGGDAGAILFAGALLAEYKARGK